MKLSGAMPYGRESNLSDPFNQENSVLAQDQSKMMLTQVDESTSPKKEKKEYLSVQNILVKHSAAESQQTSEKAKPNLSVQSAGARSPKKLSERSNTMLSQQSVGKNNPFQG